MDWRIGNTYGKSPLTVLDRLLSKILPEPNSGCWLWTGGVTRYAMMWVDRKQRQAHRLMWEQTRGPIPEGMCVCHRCDVGICINPDHLFLGTHAENMQDCIQKGRHYSTTEAFRVSTHERYSRRDPRTKRFAKKGICLVS